MVDGQNHIAIVIYSQNFSFRFVEIGPQSSLAGADDLVLPQQAHDVGLMSH